MDQPSADEPQRPPSGPYLPTLVLGLVVTAVAVLIGLSYLTDVSLDLGLVLPVGMVVLGALLLVGAAIALVSRRQG